jgi:hypothetical protein
MPVLWSKHLGKEVKYAGHNFDQWEQMMRARMRSWSAFDLRMMSQGYFDRGFASTETEVSRLTKLLSQRLAAMRNLLLRRQHCGWHKAPGKSLPRRER